MSNNIDYVYSPKHDFYIPRLTPPESPKIGVWPDATALSKASQMRSHVVTLDG